MQDSFLQNEDEQASQIPRKSVLPDPERKMYDIELSFMTVLFNNTKRIQDGFQHLLMTLTGLQEGDKKRLPYSVLRSFEKTLKQMRSIRQKIMEENQTYSLELQNREKYKQKQNAEFKKFLKQYGSKREQLKAYLTKLETRVRKLQDAGYAQYIEYDVVVPEVNTVRFSYATKLLLGMTNNKKQLCYKVADQIRRRKTIMAKIAQRATRLEVVSTKQEGKGMLEQSKELNKAQLNSKQDIKMKLPLLCIPQSIGLLQSLKIYETYKYFSNDCVIYLELMQTRKRKQQIKLCNEQLRASIKSYEQLLFKQQLINKFKNDDPQFTRTDNLIMLKQFQNQIKQKIEQKIYTKHQTIKLNKSRSWPTLRPSQPLLIDQQEQQEQQQQQ